VLQEVLAECGQGAPKLYDVDQAAEMLNIPKRWLYERTAKGEIPHQKIGKYVRFTAADLQQIIEKSSGKEPKG
jgi:excisionase family DNA binding protein